MSKKETAIVFSVIAFAVFAGVFLGVHTVKGPALTAGSIDTNRFEGNATETEKLLSAASSSVVLQPNPARSYLSCTNNNGAGKMVFLRFGTGNATFNTGIGIAASSSREFSAINVNYVGRVAAIANGVASISCTEF